MALAVAGAGISPDWTRIPEDVLVTVLGELHIRDLIRAGAVCAPWNSAYAAFRRLRLPSPRQPPCLLYYSGDSSGGAAALYCPSAGANFRIPFRNSAACRRSGSAHGWLVVADEFGNLHLTNPLTGSRVALPPITTLRGVEEGTSFDEDGNFAYSFHQEPGDTTRLARIPVGEAADCTYDCAVLSSSPSSSGGCVVLLLHFPDCALSYARLGDERWTWIPPGDGVTGLRRRNFYRNAAFNDKDGLFYVVHFYDSIYALDLNGPSPVVRLIIPELKLGGQSYKYLVHSPWGQAALVELETSHLDNTLPFVEDSDSQ